MPSVFLVSDTHFGHEMVSYAVRRCVMVSKMPNHSIDPKFIL